MRRNETLPTLVSLIVRRNSLSVHEEYLLITSLILPMLLEMTITSPEFHRTFASILRASRSSFQSVWTKQYLCLMHAIQYCYNLHHMKKLPLLSQRHKDQYRWGGYVCSACQSWLHGPAMSLTRIIQSSSITQTLVLRQSCSPCLFT